MNFQIGARAEIRTRHLSNLLGVKYQESTHTGIVVQNPAWLDNNYVCIRTGNPEFPVSQIFKPNIIGYDAPKTKIDLRVFSVKSKSTGKTYQVQVQGLNVTCDCIGFQYHKYCKHSRIVKAKLSIGA